MEDQKKTDVIKNMRTVLPPINLKATDQPDTSTQKNTPTQSSPHMQSKQPRIAPVADPSHIPNITPPNMMMYGYRQPDRERERDRDVSGEKQERSGDRQGERPGDRPPHMHMPGQGGRYRVHPSNGYVPYNPYGKAPLGYPPGRQPPHTQTRYYPPSRQHPYMGEIHPPRMPTDKKPPMMQHPPQPRHMQPGHPQGSGHPPHGPSAPHPAHGPAAILMPEAGGNNKVQIKDAMRYLDVVKEEYKNNKEVYSKFLKTMKDYKDRRINAKTVIEIMLSIFNGNQKLIQGFNQFLPKKYEILPSGEVKMHGDRKPEERGERPREEGTPKYAPSQGSREYKQHPSQAMPQGQHMQYDPRRDLEGLGIGIKPQQNRGEHDNMGRVVNYLNKVRKHLENNPSAWFEFLRIVQSYKNSREQKPISEILASIKVLLKDDPILISEFMVFLPPQEKRAALRPGQRPPPPADSLTMLHDIRNILSRKGVYKEFVKALNMFNQGLLNTNALLLIVEPFLRGSSTLFSLFRYYIGHREINAPPHVQSNLETYKKVGSYRVLPEKYRHSMHTGQSSDDASVLNTGYVACPTFSSESSTFIFAKKNSHEEALFRIEDERYECDVLLERVSSFILKLMEHEAIVIEDANISKEHNKCPIPPLKLSALDKDLISSVYGSSCDDIILGIIAHPIRAIPVILKQLRSIEAQWIKSRTASMEVWRAAVDKNYIKALDAKGYKTRSSERKTTLLKQFTKDLDSLAEVSFSLTSMPVCSEVFDILITGMEGESESDRAKTLHTLKDISLRDGVFLGTPEIYCALKGISTICNRIYDAVNGKRIKPRNNKIATDLGLQAQEPAEPISQDEILSTIRTYILEDMESSEFEEKMLSNLGIPGASLVGILGIFQSVESMLDTMMENKGSIEMLSRLEDRTTIPKSNASELLVRGINIVKISVQYSEDLCGLKASKITQPHSTSADWIDYVKNYSIESESDAKTPFLQRSVISKKRKTDAYYGMESLFTEGKLKMQYIPGTEDFIAAKKTKIE
ncbi:hypothetical protein NEIG_02162 [Nematocida sp. ERTm5]|nr:hypothetical protein NEIG_02162 [Nematocida sp. ERTm5]